MRKTKLTTHLKHLALAVAASLAFTACDRPQDRGELPEDRAMPDQEPAQERAVVDEPAGAQTDAALRQRVQTALQEDPTLGPATQNIQITAENGTVTLRGFVQSDQERDEIESRIEAMPGVDRVDNQLQVAGQ